MSDNLQNEPKSADFILYQTEDGQTQLEVRLQKETVWLTQKRMAELFQKNVRTINEHIKNIFDEGELIPESVIRNFRITAEDGKRYNTQHYNLDVIISVGYRVRSRRGTQFRIWATQRLREYIIKGFAMDDDRLKQAGGGNYFDELLHASGPRKKCSGARCWIFMPPVSTTIPGRTSLSGSSRRYKTRCIGPPTAKRRR